MLKLTRAVLFSSIDFSTEVAAGDQELFSEQPLADPAVPLVARSSSSMPARWARALFSKRL